MRVGIVPESPRVVTRIHDVRQTLSEARRSGQRIGFVPTMGALHAGHAALVRAAASASDYVVVSIFVNPTQFGPNEDFSRYPRTLDKDLRICADAGASLVFSPTVEEIYPANACTFVEVAGLQDLLEGPTRPGHFRGVCTVVLKLFHIVAPDLAYFGQKDAQQARIIRQMLRDLHLPIELRIEPTVREPDGLAMSSRNRYLTPAERAAAPGLYQCLADVRNRYLEGERQTAALEAELRTGLLEIPGSRLDYASVVDAETLSSVDHLTRPALALAAIFLGTTRLIDNVTLP